MYTLYMHPWEATTLCTPCIYTMGERLTLWYTLYIHHGREAQRGAFYPLFPWERGTTRRVLSAFFGRN